MEITPMIEATEIQVIRHGKTLLSSLSLQAHPTELLAIVGPNGAGKSTLLHVLSGQLKPTVGEVRLFNQNMSTLKPRERAHGLAFLSQHPSASLDFTVTEMVRLGRYIYRNSSPEPEHHAVVQAALTAVGLTQLQDRRYQSLSGGEKQRVHLARVLAQMELDHRITPRFLCLDEYDTHLDLAYQKEIGQLLQRLRDQQLGVIAVTHDLNFALRYADRVILLCQGRIVAAGPAPAVLQPHHIYSAFQVEMAHVVVAGREQLVLC